MKKSGRGAPYRLRLRASAERLLRGDAEGGWNDLLAAYRANPEFMFSYGEARQVKTPSRGARRNPEENFSTEALLKALGRSLRKSPRSPGLWAWSGLLRRRLADYAGAVRDLDRAWKLGARDAMVLTWRGEARLQLGDRGGMRDLEAALRRPCHAWNFAWCGRAKVNFERSRDAIACFDRAIALEPGNGWYYAWRAEAKRLLGAGDGMLEDYALALRRDPGYGYQAWVRSWRGLALLRLGRPARAARDFDAALAAKPDYALARIGRARAALALGRTQSWLRDLDRACRDDVKHLQSLYSLPRPDIEKAARALAALSAKSPRDGAVMMWRGLHLLLLGELEEALAALERAAKARPREARVFAWRAQALEQSGRLNDALADFDRAVRLAPRDPLIRAWRARARLSAGRAREARADLAESVAYDARFSWVLADLGRVELLLSRPRTAAESLRRAVAMDSGDAQAWADLSFACARLGRPAEARRAFGRARAVDPARARAARRLGKCYDTFQWPAALAIRPGLSRPGP